MSRRVANYYFWMTKIAPTLPEAAADEAHALVLLLQTVMTPESRRSYGIPGQDSAFADNIAGHAALDGLGLARGCRMHFTSFKKEKYLLRSAYRRIRRGDEKVEAQAEQELAERLHQDHNFDREPWHFALRDLLHLTCRFHTYIRLFPHRIARVWKGRLAAVIWGDQRQQSPLSRLFHSFVGLDVELTRALVLLYEGEKEADPVSDFLRRLDRASFSDPLAYESWEQRTVWLKHVLDALPDPSPSASGYTHLAAALGRLATLRDQLGETPLGRAWSEFGRELLSPALVKLLSRCQGNTSLRHERIQHLGSELQID